MEFSTGGDYMKQKTIFRDQFGCMSMGRWFLFILIILIFLQFVSGLIISFIIVFKKQPDFIPLAIGLFSGMAVEALVGMLLKTVSKNIEMSNISAREFIEKKLEETESNE